MPNAKLALYCLWADRNVRDIKRGFMHAAKLFMPAKLIFFFLFIFFGGGSAVMLCSYRSSNKITEYHANVATATFQR